MPDNKLPIDYLYQISAKYFPKNFKRSYRKKMKRIEPQDFYFEDIEKYPQLPAPEQNELIEYTRRCWGFMNQHIFLHPQAPALFRVEYEEIRKTEDLHNALNDCHLVLAENAAKQGDFTASAANLAIIDFPQSAILSVYKKLEFPVHLQEPMKQMFNEAITARNKVVNSNLKLVLKFARKLQNYGLPLTDLIQEGNIGLMRAIDKFDASQEVKFSTYAVWWIRKKVMNAIKTSNKLIRVPTHAQEALSRIIRRQDSLAEELQREPTPKELAATEGMTEEQLEHLFTISIDPISLDSKISTADDSEKHIKDMIPDPAVNLNEDLDAYKMKYDLARAFDALLTEQEKETVILRYGLFGNVTHTLEEIAQVIGKSREYVRQVEEAAFKKIKTEMPQLKEFISED